MTNHLKSIAAGLLAAVALAACDDGGGADMDGSTPPAPQTDLTYLEGSRAGQAEMNITNQGYELVRSDGSTNFWFNRASGSCAAIATSDGRYSNIDMLPSGDC
jgi:hypothetical protein